MRTEVRNEAAFAELAERYRRELQVHCYRMLGSFDESEDMVQETFLRAWRRRDSFEGRATFRSWLYRIATNACLDFLAGHARRPRPYGVAPAVGPGVPVEPPAEIPWLQPFPDRLLGGGDADPEAAAVARETIELVFLAAIQHLPPKQRAALVLRDVLGWSANDTAETLGVSVASVKSALQRARPVLQERLPRRRLDWAPGTDPTAEERALLQSYMDAAQHADPARWAELLSEDIRITMPPNPLWFAGREPLVGYLVQLFDPASELYIGDWRHLPTRANRQPAVAAYVRRPGTSVYRAQVLDVLRVEDGKVVEVTAFEPHLFPAFGLPLRL
jgi:RNA polymerase sigma-70 factor (ECF subfamily)